MLIAEVEEQTKDGWQQNMAMGIRYA